jgi:hypothetical protein
MFFGDGVACEREVREDRGNAYEVKGDGAGALRKRKGKVGPGGLMV